MKEGEIKQQAEQTLEVLRGMKQWQPERRGDMWSDGSNWAFGIPIAAFKGDNLDAVACVQVRPIAHITWMR